MVKKIRTPRRGADPDCPACHGTGKVAIEYTMRDGKGRVSKMTQEEECECVRRVTK